MANFYKYVPLLKRFEGGFSNNPNDAGGPTMRGVTLKTFRSFYGEGRTVADLRNMTDEQWAHIMKAYWDRVRGDQIVDQRVANMFADWYINSGSHAIRNVQRALGVDVDGIVGPKTLQRINGNPDDVFELIRRTRLNYYYRLVQNDPRQRVFLKGWVNRVNAL